MAKFPLATSAKIYVAGHRGMVGSALVRKLDSLGYQNLITRTSHELDLRDRKSVFEFFRSEKPEVVFLAAARVGGILANDTYPANFLSDNLLIQINVMDAAHETNVERLLFLGSSCIYPKFAEQPIREEALMTGRLEPTNEAYAVAKIAGIQHVTAMRKQYGHRWISAMPSNLYGPGDNYDPQGSHVLPALIRRYEEARLAGVPQVTNWGTGTPLREFLFVDDLADACFFLIENYDESSQINIGTGEDLSIRELARLVAEIVGYEGVSAWDTSKPDGAPRKLLDITKAKNLGWQAETALWEGIALAVADFRARFGDAFKSHK
jgi:GDP-L-fucose synthase